ncbi:MAG: type II toxin-antitoxin system RelE/ParE family toxin [Spirochaetaceae bacterium]|nr:type II toxin-antitoxin system RelE/ParE family toxin [Spirochaetaceae bacterium]
MKKWIVDYTKDAQKDYAGLDGSQRPQVLKAIEKVRKNPLPDYEGGYGKSLGNKGGKDLHGLLKIKLKKLGLRIVYKLVRQKDVMKIIVISVRNDDEVYKTAFKRITNEKH